MSLKNITRVGLKIMGVYLLSKAILYIPAVVTSVSSFFGGSAGTVYGKLMAASIMLSFALLTVAGAWFTFKDDGDYEGEEIALPKNSFDLLVLGFSIAGIIIFSLAITDFPLLIIKVMAGGGVLESGLEGGLRLAGNVIQLLLGALLFFRAKYFAKFVK